MPYLYGNIKDAKVGDVVESLTSDEDVTAGKLYVILKGSNNGSFGHYVNDKGKHSNGICNSADFWKLVQTKPGSKAVKGDEIISITENPGSRNIGQIFTAHTNADSVILYYTSDTHTYPRNFLVLCKEKSISQRVAIVTVAVNGHPVGSKIIIAETNGTGIFWKLADGSSGRTYIHSIGSSCEWLDELPTKHNIAYYKRSGAPWTSAEFKNIASASQMTPSSLHRKWIFQSSEKERDSYMWIAQERHPHFKNCTQMAYEDVFGDIKEVQVAPKYPHLNKTSVYQSPSWREDIMFSYSEETGQYSYMEGAIYTQTGVIAFKPAYHSNGTKAYSRVDDTILARTYLNDITKPRDPLTFQAIGASTAPNHIPKITNLCNEVLAEQAVHCALTTTNSQEATMPQNSISININGNTINLDGAVKPKKVKTDLKLSPECISLWYNENGAFARQTNDTAKQAKKLLQKVANIGYTVRTYTISDAATTSIPVVNVAI